VPTADLPMLRPLKSWGVQQGVIDTLERVLRPIIDSAYVRNDPIRNGPMSPGPAMRTAAAKPAAASVRAAERKTATKAAKRQAPNSRSTLN
ncbi:PE-PPE domain-containing protein, partial [Mycolicibacterium sp.]|uniref:PE-PPE domain-containing protein n=1 Tax=Mycolicibacterium sp. TaxID=2320850 RepID=UPI001A33DA1D